ncbi:hypothetical protein FDG2_0709 [Candidatus Protofrankia californiensis]|uniref:Secreted protein n=1 Tax=Candidatus Protofrankia californiensis TaxID=1839754 RepID=A0A1C3NU61_9ACTN|nr:hypothetical protein FDG2_0709 [Candidatus Protofrankia californiensis]
MRTKRLITGAASLLSAMLLLAAAPVAANAAEPSAPAVKPTADSTGNQEPTWATFEGKQINLKNGWGEAQVCSVFPDRTTECFRTIEEAETRERAAGLGTAPAAAGDATIESADQCDTPLNLYEDGGYGGRHLRFWGRGYWQNLTDWSFNDEMSSYVTGACYVHLAEHVDGLGWWYPGDTSPNHGEAVLVAGWNDRVSSILID